MAGCKSNDFFRPYYDNEKLQIIYSIDATIYTFDNKAVFKIIHNRDESNSSSRDELYISSTEVDNVINNGSKILSGYFNSFAYSNNLVYLKMDNTYYVIDIINEEKNAYSNDDFLQFFPDYDYLNWYNT